MRVVDLDVVRETYFLLLRDEAVLQSRIGGLRGTVEDVVAGSGYALGGLVRDTEKFMEPGRRPPWSHCDPPKIRR